MYVIRNLVGFFCGFSFPYFLIQLYATYCLEAKKHYGNI